MENIKETQEAIDYLDIAFPKGETKYRGKAMILMALSIIAGREEQKIISGEKK